MPLLLGITGKIGAGKNFITSMLEKRGWRSLDLDQVAHDVLNKCSDEIAGEFGQDVLCDDGRVNRQILGKLVFANLKKLETLESMLYPLIVSYTDQWLDSDKRPAVIHAVNLHKTAYPESSAAVIWVWAPFWIRRHRVISRDRRPWNLVKQRFRRQNQLKPKLLASRAEIYRVGNFGQLRHIERRIDHILKLILEG